MNTRLQAVIVSILMTASIIVPLTVLAPTSAACPGAQSFGVGGAGNGNSSVFWGRVDTPVYYSGNLNDVEGGINALTRDVNDFRRYCPRSQILLTGHSQGAAIVHIYLTRNPWLRNVPAAAVLFADPKQLGSGESDGSFAIAGYPIAGTDNWFNGIPTVSICSWRDVICNRGAGWAGYLFENAHVAPYQPFDPYAYMWWTGTVWKG